MKATKARLFSGLWVHFIVIVFATMILFTVILSSLLFLLVRLHTLSFREANHWLFWLIMLLVSIAVGTSLTIVVGHRILRPVSNLGRAAQLVAKGDFSVRLSEHNPIKELDVMARDFNKMVQDLSGIETLRSDFVVNVSHEFKTPLSAIEGYATLLQEPELSLKERQEYTGMIIESTRQLASLSNHILSLSKLENQEILAEITAFQLDEQIRQALLLLENNWSNKQLELDLHLDSIVYHGSEELLHQVWLNLIGNAIKFTPDHGTIMVVLEQIDNDVRITISDTGIGMHPQTIEHIFEKFYQGDKTRFAEGNGLGLTLVKRIIELSNGKIEVKSSLGNGSTFVVILPVSV